MCRFIQLHLLTSYPPSNLNRDDLGRPKTARMGGFERLRISSQSLKRAWRKSELFETALAGHIGVRTKKMGIEVFDTLQQKGIAEKNAKDWALKIVEVFNGGKKKEKEENKKEKEKKKKKEKEPEPEPTISSLETKQLVHFSPEEQAAVMQLAETIAQRNSEPTKEELQLLREKHSAADIALFGRMLAKTPIYNIEAAAQVAHAITVHEVAVEDDFFTAVDDLNSGEQNAGAAHLGETEFGAGLYYLYICIDRALLIENLQNDEVLVNKTLAALVECAAKVAPTGKQNSFASRAYTSYLLAEKGNQQPRSLSVAFLKPVKVGSKDDSMLDKAIEALETTRKNMDKVYGNCADKSIVMNANQPKGSLDRILKFIYSISDK